MRKLGLISLAVVSGLFALWFTWPELRKLRDPDVVVTRPAPNGLETDLMSFAYSKTCRVIVTYAYVKSDKNVPEYRVYVLTEDDKSAYQAIQHVSFDMNDSIRFASALRPDCAKKNGDCVASGKNSACNTGDGNTVIVNGKEAQ